MARSLSMESGKLKWAFIANTVTLLGSSLGAIPVSQYLAQHTNVAWGWALYLALSRGPSIVFVSIIPRIAFRFKPNRVLCGTQWLASFCLAGAVAAYWANLFWLFVGMLGASLVMAAYLPSLFPAVLKSFGVSGALQKQLSHWHMAKHIALVVATGLGGFLQGSVSVPVILAIDAASFAFAGLVWLQIAKAPVAVEKAVSSENSVTSHFFSRLQLSNLSRKLAFGLINPLLAVGIYERFQMNGAGMGLLYMSLGSLAILGGLWTRSKQFSVLAICGLLLIEGLALVTGTLAFSPILFFAAFGLAAFVMSPNDITLQSRFLASDAATDSSARSAVFECGANIALVAGYFLYPLYFAHQPLWMLAAVVGALGIASFALFRLDA